MGILETLAKISEENGEKAEFFNEIIEGKKCVLDDIKISDEEMPEFLRREDINKK